MLRDYVNMEQMKNANVTYACVPDKRPGLFLR